MKIVRVACCWRVVGFGRVVHGSLEGLALRQGYRVGAVCGALGLSEGYFREIFLRDVGLSPKEWMKWERMVVARRMVAWGMRVRDVSDALGFSDETSFRREFRAVYGMPPQRYMELRLPDHG